MAGFLRAGVQIIAFGMLPLSTAAQTVDPETISAEIARTGLAATEARLITSASTDPADIFALGGIQFLRAIEISYQTRWQSGLSDPTGMIPLLRLPVPPNPTPVEFDPATVTTIFAQTSWQLDLVQTTLGQLPPDAAFGLEIQLGHLWFDVNMNAVREEGEGLLDLAGPALLGWQWAERDPALPYPTVRFDVADAAWLSAYAHLLAGISDVIRAYDPTEPLARIVNARSQMQALGPMTPDFILGSAGGFDLVDMLAVVLETLKQQPDAGLMASAQGHFLNMITQNRNFWARVGIESDNQMEWLPNDSQQSALAIPLAPGTGTAWLAVLTEVEAIVQGKALLPYWRMQGPVGVNLGRMFTQPAPIDLIGWVQGYGALPYLERGTIAGFESVQAFAGMVNGDPMLLALFLN